MHISLGYSPMILLSNLIFNAIVGAADHAIHVRWLLTCAYEANLFSDVATKQTTFDDIMAVVREKQEEEAAAHPSAMRETRRNRGASLFTAAAADRAPGGVTGGPHSDVGTEEEPEPAP